MSKLNSILSSNRMNLLVITSFAYLACIILSNLALSWWGMMTVFDIMLPAGTWFAGVSFTLRDFVDDLGGRKWVLAAIAAGGVLSLTFAPSFALASTAAFLLSETIDWLVYRPLRQRGLVIAVTISNAIGSTIDSLLFLWLAFGTVTGWSSLTLAKIVMVLPFLLLMRIFRSKP